MTNPKSERTKPEDTDFYQQRLRAWQPLLTPWYIILTFLIVGLIFIPIGLVVLFTSNDVVELEQQYSCDGPSCTVDLLVEKDMKAPVYFYYKLTNFYQNHRRYVKSRSDTQLAGTDGSTTLCDPLENYDGKLLYPCGLVANSFFNDNFKVTVSFANDDGTLEPPHPLTETEFDESDIAWETDRDNKYKDIYKNKPLPDTMTREGPSGTLPYLDNQHFMVWMRTAGLPTFRKLYAKINVDLKAGSKVSVDIDDKFDVASFDGTKAVVISTASWLGGKNLFLGYAYVVVGGICLLFALIFTIKQKTCPRDLGSIAFLKLSSKKA